MNPGIESQQKITIRVVGSFLYMSTISYMSVKQVVTCTCGSIHIFITQRWCSDIITKSDWWEACHVQSPYHSWKFIGYSDNEYTKDELHAKFIILYVCLFSS